MVWSASAVLFSGSLVTIVDRWTLEKRGRRQSSLRHFCSIGIRKSPPLFGKNVQVGVAQTRHWRRQQLSRWRRNASEKWTEEAASVLSPISCSWPHLLSLTVLTRAATGSCERQSPPSQDMAQCPSPSSTSSSDTVVPPSTATALYLALLKGAPWRSEGGWPQVRGRLELVRAPSDESLRPCSQWCVRKEAVPFSTDFPLCRLFLSSLPFPTTCARQE